MFTPHLAVVCVCRDRRDQEVQWVSKDLQDQLVSLDLRDQKEHQDLWDWQEREDPRAPSEIPAVLELQEEMAILDQSVSCSIDDETSMLLVLYYVILYYIVLELSKFEAKTIINGFIIG